VNGNDIATFNMAVQYARQGYKEKAYDCIKSLAQNDANNLDLILWGVYTAPNLERAQALLDRAKSLNPDYPALVEADLWLTNEMYDLPQPAEGYSLFPPNPQIIINSLTINQQTIIAAPMAPPQPAYYSRPYYPPPQPTYIMPPPIIINTVQAYACPFCRSPYPPLTGTRVSTGGWVTFGVLLVFFFPLCWIGLLSKTPYSYCGQCGAKFF
jgi:hypothetical protein